MGRTIAEALRWEGFLEGTQETLVMELRQKFGKKVTAAITAKIEKTTDLDKLYEWLGNIIDANTLAEVGISGRKKQSSPAKSGRERPRSEPIRPDLPSSLKRLRYL